MQHIITDLPDLLGRSPVLLIGLIFIAAFGLSLPGIRRWLACGILLPAFAAASAVAGLPFWLVIAASLLGIAAGRLGQGMAGRDDRAKAGPLIVALIGVSAGFALGLVMAVLAQSSWRLLGLAALLLAMALILTLALRAVIDGVLPWLARRRATVHPLPGYGLPLALFAVAFIWLGHSVIAQYAVRVDTSVSAALTGLRNQPGDAVMIFLTSFGDWPVVTVTSAAMSFWLLARGQWRIAVGFALTVALTSLLTSTLKLTLAVQRPNDFYSGVQAFSFPSGHSSSAAVLFGLLAWFAWRLPWPLPARRLPVLLVVTACTIAFSRLYLGAHWPSDVLGGFLLGGAMVTLFALAFRRSTPADLAPAGGLAVTLAAFAIFGSAYAVWFMPRAEARYARAVPQPAPVSQADWLATGWQDLPSSRSDQMAGASQDFALQWAGTSDDLAAALATAGWAAPDAQALVPLSLEPARLPVQPRLQDGHMPALVLTRPATDGIGRQVLFGWNSAMTLRPNLPVLLVMAVQEEIIRPLPFLALSRAGNQPLAFAEWGGGLPAQPRSQPPRQVWLAPIGNP